MIDLDTAELAVLGSILLTNGTALDDIDFSPNDYRHPTLEFVHRTMQDMKAAGQPIDLLTVSDAISKSGERVDPTLLHRAQEATPSAASVDHYAGMVTDAATLRRLQSAAGKIQAMASEGGDADEIVEAAHREMEGTQSRSRSQPVQFVADTIEGTIDYLEEEVSSTPTLWEDVNDIIGGLRPGGLYVVGARPSVGKALALDTPIPTPTGWTTMGKIAVGEHVIGMDGNPVRVVAATEVMTDRPCYRVTFKDGTEIIADEQHQWLTSTRAARRAATPPKGYEFKRDSPYSNDQRHKSEVPSVKTTGDIFATQRAGSDDRANHVVPPALPVQSPDVDLPVDPYLFGYWLGDGASHHASLTVGEQDREALMAQIEKRGYFCSVHKDGTVGFSHVPIIRGGAQRECTKTRLRALGVIQNKHIPMLYMRASEAQRRELLAGLLDSDGTASSQSGRVAFAVTSKALALGFQEVARSLGYVTNMNMKIVKGRSEESSICYTVGFMADRDVFQLERKNALVRNASRGEGRPIVKVERIESVPVRCIQVDNEDHMYLCSEAFIPTHNSVVGLQIAQALLPHGSVAFMSLEMSVNDLTTRMLSNELRIDMGKLTTHNLDAQDWARIGEWVRERRQVPLAINDNTGSSITDIKRFARNVNRKKPLAGVIVDYLQLMAQQPGDKRPRHEFVADMSRQLKILAMDMQVPVIALSQLNRSSESREDKRPGLHDLRESGAIEQDADVVILLHREIMGDKSGEMSIAIAKNRHGRTGAVNLDFAGHYSEVRSRHQWPQAA